ncbi:MAG: hypothetical protein KDE01_23785 [Caldilineaceae bacterium]|nr:hypothetical protein [Caldilineaceae bacterium]MCB0150658.1 hypothetical protein [Caldilineaceae bacterium]
MKPSKHSIAVIRPCATWLQPGIQTIPTRRRIVAIERIDEHTVRVRYQEYASIR